MRQCGAAVRSACDTVTPLRSVSMLQTCCSSFTQHWRSAALSVQKRIQTDEHDTQTETFMHISITHTPTHTHRHAHTGTACRHASGPPASPRSHIQTQARARTHAREPRTPTPARDRSATAALPRRRLHPSLPLHLAGTRPCSRCPSSLYD
jgi:hypothetical protein